MTPFEFATDWYKEEEIYSQLKKANMISGEKVPEDIYSREFAKWLTHEYRLAMAKGIQIGTFSKEYELEQE